MLNQNKTPIERVNEYLYTIKDRIGFSRKKALRSEHIQIEGPNTVARTHKQ